MAHRGEAVPALSPEGVALADHGKMSSPRHPQAVLEDATLHLLVAERDKRIL